MGSELVRFSVAMPSDLLADLDAYSQRRGTLKNRSEAIRDLVRNALVEETIEEPDAQVFATLTMVFDHHANDLRDKLDDIQHAHCNEIVSSMHVHVDAHNCLEVIIMRGRSADIRDIADALLGTKGVLNGDLVTTVVGSEYTHPHDHHIHVDADADIMRGIPTDELKASKSAELLFDSQSEHHHPHTHTHADGVTHTH